MNRDENLLAKLLAEVLRVQRWAGGDSVSAARIHGLMHGFESVLKQELESFGVSEDVQEKVEQILVDIESGQQATDGLAIKDRLRRDHINETDAIRVLELCRLQEHFPEEIDVLTKELGSAFPHIDRMRQPEQNWFGALHYMELVDCTEDVHKKLHAVFAASVPRIGETVTPENGTAMEVVGVEYMIISQGEREGVLQPILVPYVYLEAIDDENGEADVDKE
jgi:hypothetical protein